MDPIAELQSQLIALRLATEGAWLSLLANDAAPGDAAARLKGQNLAAIDQMDVSSAQARTMRDAVHHHTEQLWGSIEWQLRHLQDGAQG